MNTEKNTNTRNVSFPIYAQIAGLQRHSESSPPYDSNLKQTANEDITPVSYTHLDVYKRQCLESLLGLAATVTRENRVCPDWCT